MSYSRYSRGALVLATLSSCVIHQQLGQPGGDSSTTGDDADTTTTTADGVSQSSTSSPSSGSNTSAPQEDTADDPTAETFGDTVAEMEPAQTCFDYAPPSRECDVHRDATAWASGDQLPVLDDAACTVVSVESSDVDEDTLTLDCGELYALQIATSAPHLDLPLVGGEAVRLTAREVPFPNDTAVGSFAIRSTAGELVLAWVNTNGMDLDATSHVDIDIDITPVVAAVSPSGCDVTYGGEVCDADGTVAQQRSMLELGDAQLFDGNEVLVPVGDRHVAVIAERVERIVCWDDDCAGSDAGPFEWITFIMVALPDA
ncbi:MAG TPA: hypothetical protein VG755_10340 [Nannocystaceae bacterium]|nr:hypothetical protein [Nannocystaceae bacterium]